MSLWLQLLKKKKTSGHVLQYIQTTGTQAINLGYYTDNTSNMKLTVQLMSTQNNSSSFFGSNGNMQCKLGNFSAGTKYIATVTHKPNLGPIVTKDGVEIVRQSFHTYVDIAIFLGGLGESRTTFDHQCKMRIYSAKLQINNVTVRDMIPKLHSAGVKYINGNTGQQEVSFEPFPCLYDKITSMVFKNVGTGQFIYQ